MPHLVKLSHSLHAGEFISILDISTTLSLEEQYVEIHQTMTQLDQAADLVVSLEELTQVIGHDGSMLTPREAALIQIAADIAVAGTNVSAESLIPSLEDNQVGEKVSSNIKDKIVAIIKMIKEVILKLWEKFLSYIEKFKDHFIAWKSTVSEFSKRFDKIEDFSIGKNKTISVITPVSTSGKPLSQPSVLIDGFKNYIDTVKKSTKDRQQLQKRTGHIRHQADVIVKILANTGLGESTDIEGLLSLVQQYAPMHKHSFIGGLQIQEGLDPTNEHHFDSKDTIVHLQHLYRSMRVKVETTDGEADRLDMSVMTKPELRYALQILKELEALVSFEFIGSAEYDQNREYQNAMEKVTKALEHFKEDSNVILQILSKNAYRRREFCQKIPIEFLNWSSNYSTIYFSTLLRHTLKLTSQLSVIVERNLRTYGV